MNSPLARYAHIGREPNRDEARALCRKAWHEDGILCVMVDEVTPHKNRAQLEQIGTEMFGRRKPRTIDGRGY